jgi:hypothetical protein
VKLDIQSSLNSEPLVTGLASLSWIYELPALRFWLCSVFEQKNLTKSARVQQNLYLVEKKLAPRLDLRLRSVNSIGDLGRCSDMIRCVFARVATEPDLKTFVFLKPNSWTQEGEDSKTASDNRIETNSSHHCLLKTGNFNVRTKRFH